MMYSNGYNGGKIGVKRSSSGGLGGAKFSIVKGFGASAPSSAEQRSPRSSTVDLTLQAAAAARLQNFRKMFSTAADNENKNVNGGTEWSSDYYGDDDYDHLHDLGERGREDLGYDDDDDDRDGAQYVYNQSSSSLTKQRHRESLLQSYRLNYVGVATLGVLFAMCLPFLTDLISHKSRNTATTGGRGLMGITHLPRELIISTFQGMAHLVLPHRQAARSGALHSNQDGGSSSSSDNNKELLAVPRPDFVYDHPYVSSSYYTSTKSINTLIATEEIQVGRNNLQQQQAQDSSLHQREIKTRLAIVRPFCEFDAEALPTTFTCWNALPPCKAAQDDLGDDDGDWEDEEQAYMTEYQLGDDGEFHPVRNKTMDGNTAYNAFFDQVGSDAMKSATADVFLFYSQTFSENEVAIKAVDTIIDSFFEPGGWSQCFENIYAIEANIPQELDLYIPSAQEELYNWVNGPNRQYEAAFRIIQSGEWGEYDGFYLMEGDSVPIKAHWLDVVLSEIEVHRPFAILGA